MRIGIDAQAAATGNRSGLYTYLRCLTHELRQLPGNEVRMLAVARRKGASRTNSESVLGAAFDGTPTTIVSPPRRLYRVWHRLSRCNRVDVLMHGLHGSLPRTTRGANVYVVPDVIPLGFDYGIPGFADGYREYYETAIRSGDALIVWSEHTKRDVLDKVGGNADQIWVCPLAAGPEFTPADPSKVSDCLARTGLAGDKYILCVATLEKRKNHGLLLRAFEKLIRKDPHLPHKLVLVGGKWVGHEEVFESARKLQLGDRFVYLGFADSLPLIYAGADAFVFPSLYEGFGLPPLEAMACGVPTLVANATALPEVIGDGGLLFDPHDEAKLADMLRRVLTDRRYHRELGERALTQAARYTWGRTAQDYMTAFRSGYERFHAKGAA